MHRNKHMQSIIAELHHKLLYAANDGANNSIDENKHADKYNSIRGQRVSTLNLYTTIYSTCIIWTLPGSYIELARMCSVTAVYSRNHGGFQAIVTQPPKTPSRRTCSSSCVWPQAVMRHTYTNTSPKTKKSTLKKYFSYPLTSADSKNPCLTHLPLKFRQTLYISETTTSLHFCWSSTVVQGTEVLTPKISDLNSKKQAAYMPRSHIF